MKKIQTEISNACKTIEYKLIGSIMKDHFKELMQITKKYSWRWDKKTGKIDWGNLSDFKIIVEKINDADDELCKKSHQSCSKNWENYLDKKMRKWKA